MFSIFLLYPAREFYWRWKQEYPVKTNNLLKSLLHNVVLSTIRQDREYSSIFCGDRRID